MLVGYNNNVTYKGKVYHVQTEDSGLKNPIIVTLLYYKGTILASKKTDYSRLLAPGKDLRNDVRELMKEQHKTMLKELIAGKYHAKEGQGIDLQQEDKNKSAEAIITGAKHPESEVNAYTGKTLDDILLDYIMQREKKR